MHTDVKGVQVSGNTVFNWPGQGPTLSAVFEDEACRDNSIVSNSFNYYTTAEAVISKGTNTLVANNYARKEAFAHPAKTPFAKPHPDFRIAAFKRDGLEEYFHSRYSPMMSEK
jgi:tRNA(His) 5'-end guanylyltransferase